MPANNPNMSRSAIMAAVPSQDTTTELVVRSYLHKKGLRYALHNPKLPGKPDLSFPKFKTVVFVHGCFWHQHQHCERSKRPKTNKEYWNAKLDRNVSRDKRNLSELSTLGWKPLIIWECKIKEERELRKLYDLITNANNS